VFAGTFALPGALPAQHGQLDSAQIAPTSHATGRDRSVSRSGLLVVTSTAGEVRLDGNLDGSTWAHADSITDFRQRDPAEGAPASERTVVKLVRDHEALYVGVRAYDRTPAAIRAAQLRRDADLSSDDNVTILIDSFNDRRSGFLFRTNPNGAMWDAQIAGVETENVNWNGIWGVAVSRDSLGWTAEFRIPFRTLRFRAGAGAAFGFNVRRFVRRRNEEDLWRSWRRAQGLRRLENEGTLTGFGGLGRARDVELRPYALGRVVESEHDSTGARTAGGSVGGKAGVDAKLALSPTLTADVTVNTDFAQVEVDSQVINLTRFPTFFPEKREFFLESSDIFQFGTEMRAQLFYSRRIGLSDSGQAVPILGGARAYGKVGPWAVGALNVRTGSGDEANDAVVRVKHDLFERSYIGAIAMQRSGPGVRGIERAGGVDLDFPLVVGGQNVEPALWIAATRTPDSSGTPVAWRLSTDYPNDLFDNFVSLYHIERGFDPTLGFVLRTGIWQTRGHINYMPRPHLLGLRRLDIQLPLWDIIADAPGSLGRVRDWQTAFFEWRPLGGDFESGDRFEVNVQRQMDAPTDSFAIFRGVIVPPGRYWWTRTELQYELSPGRPISGLALVSWGDFYDGRDTELFLSTTWRGGGHVILGANVARSAVRLSTGSFTALQITGRLEYAFTTRSDFLAFVQSDNESQRVDFNLRFHWIPVIGDDFFVVWNSGYTTDPRAPFRFPDSRALTRPLNGAFAVKLVHRFAP
jgi:Domain of unknown function (DUF5916)/Carbohydrate family 9 binding domain-like